MGKQHNGLVHVQAIASGMTTSTHGSHMVNHNYYGRVEHLVQEYWNFSNFSLEWEKITLGVQLLFNMFSCNCLKFYTCKSNYNIW